MSSTRVFNLRKLFFVVLFAVILCVSAAFATDTDNDAQKNAEEGGTPSVGAVFEPISCDTMNLNHGDPLTVHYDLSGYQGDHYDYAELRIQAQFKDPNQNLIDASHECVCVRLEGTSGSYTYTDTCLGDWLTIEISLWNKSEWGDWGEWVDVLWMDGAVQFNDGWRKPAIPTLSMNYAQTAVTAHTPISATYVLSGVDGDERHAVGWIVLNEDGQEEHRA